MNTNIESSFHPAFVLFLVGVVISLLIWKKKSLQRGLQVLSIFLFVGLIWLAAYDGRPTWPVDFFLFSDPLLALIHTLTSHILVPLLLVSLVFVVLAALMGRIFCSHICPLGTLFDVSDSWIAKAQRIKTNQKAYKRARKAKLVILFVVIGAALAGFNLLGWCDPIVIFTRFVAIVFYPIVMSLSEVGLEIIRPLGVWFSMPDLAYYEIILPSYEGAIFMALLLIGLLVLSRMQPRFWCRHLCPLGALLGLVGRWAPYRRRVSEDCNACNKCVRSCPTGAIHVEGQKTDRSECIVCRQCERICSEGAVRFGFEKKDPVFDQVGTNLSRRIFFGGVAGGLVAGMGLRSDMLHPSDAFLPFPQRDKRLIRPPGALPEPEFLSRCVRCGECMRACLTNTIQPDWHRAGLEGIWAPHLNLRHAACEQTCNLCGHVCPTEAIRPLDNVEKQHAKIGTAVVIRDRCLPWSQDRRCLICDEQCPYNAIVFKHDAEHKMGLPIVNADKCNGCGQCEDKCPVMGEAAIVVVPQGELRLKEGSYVEEAKALGLIFHAKGGPTDQLETSQEKPSPEKKSGDKPDLPPGIIADPDE
jgi:MauM/NapG family ferredoxin protein